MGDKDDVGKRRKRIGILRARQLKSLIVATPRRFEEQIFKGLLAVGSKGAKIRQQASVPLERLDRRVRFWVDRAIKRGYGARTEARLQFGESASAV